LLRGAAVAGAVSAAAAMIASVIPATDARRRVSAGARKPATRRRAGRAFLN